MVKPTIVIKPKDYDFNRMSVTEVAFYNNRMSDMANIELLSVT